MRARQFRARGTRYRSRRVEPLSLAILTATALATSVVSGMLGLAGGIILLSVLLLFLEPLVAIPLHGVIQLVSNSSRAWIQRRHVHGGIALRYALPLVPLGFAGLAFAERLPPRTLEAAIGVFVILATWRPAWLLPGRRPDEADSTPRILLPRGPGGGNLARHAPPRPPGRPPLRDRLQDGADRDRDPSRGGGGLEARGALSRWSRRVL